jgi:hypothetical protein
VAGTVPGTGLTPGDHGGGGTAIEVVIVAIAVRLG